MFAYFQNTNLMASLSSRPFLDHPIFMELPTNSSVQVHPIIASFLLLIFSKILLNLPPCYFQIWASYLFLFSNWFFILWLFKIFSAGQLGYLTISPLFVQQTSLCTFLAVIYRVNKSKSPWLNISSLDFKNRCARVCKARNNFLLWGFHYGITMIQTFACSNSLPACLGIN